MDRTEWIKKAKTLAPMLSAVLVAACVGYSLHGYETPVYAVEDTVVKDEETKKEQTKETARGSFDLADGIYQGTGTGFAGEITVAVQIKDKQILSIEILSTSDDEAFFHRAETVVDRIIEAQSLDVDTVSGATYSSKGIISAVKNALTGEKDSGEAGVSQSGGAAAGSALSAGTVEDAKAYKDGVYYGTGTGFGGTLRVEVEISGGKITSIQVVEHNDGSSYMQKASGLIANIISSQSTNVDTVSGATYSSVGIIQAVRSALSQASVENGGTSGNVQNGNGTNSGQEQDTSGDSFVTETIAYDEGIYYGTAEGYNGDITVAVVIQDHTIKAILVMETEDDEAFFGRAMDVLKQVVKKQSTEVDTVSGATYSSTGLLNAVKNALKEAENATNGEIPDNAQRDTALLEQAIAEAEALTAEEYTEASWAILQVRLQDAKKALEDGTQEEINKAQGNLDAAMTLLVKRAGGEEEEETVYLDGVYSGAALCLPDEDEDFEGYRLSLKITVRNDQIVSVTEVSGDGDPSNDSYIKRAANGTSKMEGVITQIIKKGKAEEIDAVSGATCSSKAILDACENALESAKRPESE